MLTNDMKDLLDSQNASEKKSKIIIIRLTEAEYKQVDAKAWASRRSKSEFARDAINRYLNSADSDKDCLPF